MAASENQGSERLHQMASSAGIYCRISEDKVGAGLGVERQRQDCLAIIERKGWKVFDVYTDNDISAYSGKPRPAYKRLCQDIESGLVGAVVVWHLDRLHRQPRELESFIDLVERYGVQLASVSGEHDLSTPEGRLHARILGAVARMESEHKSRRIRRQKQQRREEGLPLGGGYRAYGFERDGLTHVPHEAEVLREAGARILGGESLRSVCFTLNRRGDLTTATRGWTGRSLTRVLISPRSAGLVVMHDGRTVRAQWPAIFTDEERQELVAFFAKRKTGKHWKRRFLLSGLLRCGECGAPLVAGSPRDNRGRIYWCYPYPNRGCGHVTITASFVEPMITEAVLSVLGNVSLHPNQETLLRERDAKLRDIERDQQLLEQLAHAFADRSIGMHEWLAARQPIEARIQSVTHELNAPPDIRRVDDLATAGNPHSLWETMSVDQQRSVIGTVIDHIEVHRVGKGRYKDPQRLHPVWRA